MGDRTYAEISINEYYYQTHKEAIDAMDYNHQDESSTGEVTFYDYEANYGCLTELEKFCRDHKIEYDKHHEAGGEFEAGEEYGRVVNGEFKVHELSKSYVEVKGTIKGILTDKDDPEKMIARMQKLVEELEPFEVTPLKPPQSIDFIKNA